eukprot:995678-Prymnesium_polylepis.1
MAISSSTHYSFDEHHPLKNALFILPMRQDMGGGGSDHGAPTILMGTGTFASSYNSAECTRTTAANLNRHPHQPPLPLPPLRSPLHPPRAPPCVHLTAKSFY